MMEQLSSPPKSLVLPVYVDNVACAQVARPSPTRHAKSSKFNPI